MPTNPKRQLEALKWEMVAIFGKLLVDLLFKTTPIETVGFEQVKSIIETRKFIFAFWHSRILLINYLYKGWNGLILVSKSQDGEFIARVAQRQGHEAVRGSTTRGGLRALATMIKRMKQNNRPAGIIPDGPQGPRFKIQPGVITLAKKTGYPIVPVSYSAKRIKIFNSWDRFILPYPFTRCRIIYGEPLNVPADAGAAIESSCRLRLEAELCKITSAADCFFGHTIS